MKRLNLSLFADDIVVYVENRESYGSHKKRQPDLCKFSKAGGYS